MPTDFFRLPAGAGDAINASTAACLIEHAIAWKRLQQTAEALLSVPPPPTADIENRAQRTGDTELVYVINVCTPLLKAVMTVCRNAELKYITSIAKEAAVSAAANQDEPLVTDVGGIHVCGQLFVATKDPVEFTHAAIVRRQSNIWKPMPADDAESFVKHIDDSISSVDALVDSLKALLGYDDDDLKNNIIALLNEP